MCPGWTQVDCTLQSSPILSAACLEWEIKSPGPVLLGSKSVLDQNGAVQDGILDNWQWERMRVLGMLGLG